MPSEDGDNDSSRAREDTPLLQPVAGTAAAASQSPRLRRLRLMITRQRSSLVEPFADDSGSFESVRSGLTTIVVAGCIIGVCMPKNTSLPTPWYRTISSAIGYTYFLAWSVSFYPQVMSNHKRKSTAGLSNDFSVINHVGYICYTVYTTTLFWSESIQEEYKQRYGPDAKITVQSNDVAFAMHALVFSFVWVAQIYYYGGFKVQGLSRIIRFLLSGICITCCSFATLISLGFGGFTWLDFMYLLSLVKVIITFSKYVPQVMLNARRKSTVGWSPWNVTLDISGGGLSFLQLVLDSSDLEDWSGITGNLAKLGLSFLTIFFDVSVSYYILSCIFVFLCYLFADTSHNMYFALQSNRMYHHQSSSNYLRLYSWCSTTSCIAIM